MGAVTVSYFANRLDPETVERRVVARGDTVGDCVRDAFPKVELARVELYLDGELVDELCPILSGEIVVVVARPGGPYVTAAELITWAVTALISMAVSFVIGYLTKPKKRGGKNASPAYSVNIDQNAARIGQEIPVIYGRVLAMPDIASQPYSEFANNNELVGMLLCLGMGEYEINDIYIGETRVTDFPLGTVTVWIVPPTVHKQTLGVIEDQTGIVEDMFTIPETGGVSLDAPNDPSELVVRGHVTGGLLYPAGGSTVALWIGLVIGQKYIITNTYGQTVTAIYLGLGPENSAVFDQDLPTGYPPIVFGFTGTLTPTYDALEGDVMALTGYADTGATARLPPPETWPDEVDPISGTITATAGGITRGPYAVYRTSPNGLTHYLLKNHHGETSENDTPITPSQYIEIAQSEQLLYSVTPWSEDTPTEADPYRWRGWWTTSRPGVTVEIIWIDVNAPGGIAWITDKGDYNRIGFTCRVDIQEVDDNSTPVGTVRSEFFTMTGATANPQRRSWRYIMDKPARYRVRVARVNNRDQRASKEISKAEISAIRCKIFHAEGTPAYENATLLAIRFAASAGLSAAANRRIKVDCTRRLPNLATGVMQSTTNPADAFADVLENKDYGAARPRSELDTPQLLKLRPQWGTTNGFNGVFDQATTVIEALQAIVGPVRAIPLPIGSVMSVAQDAPRARDFVFGPETIVAGSLSLGYNFDGTDEPDHLEVTYTDPATFADARVYYPSKGVRPESSELFGCTSAEHAAAWARLRWQERYANRKTAQFELEGEGYLIQPLTRYGLTIPNIDAGTGGIVLVYESVSRELVVDTPPPATATVIHFKNPDGTNAAGVTFSRLGERKLKLATAPPFVPVGSSEHGDGTRWVTSSGAERFFEFSVINLEAAGPMRIKVTGQQYTDDKYDGTFVEGWVT